MTRWRAFALLLLAAGSAQLSAGWYLPAKAALAQVLLRVAWERTRASGEPTRPWPWAKHWPVARLQAPALSVDEIVLAGAGGASLAFGPGHIDGTPLPGEAGNAVLAGHRDTSFAFLATLRRGDLLLVETPRGLARRYRVIDTRVVERDDRGPYGRTAAPTLTLVTCYPFDAVWPGTDLRYVVRAEAGDQPERRSRARSSRTAAVCVGSSSSSRSSSRSICGSSSLLAIRS
jgi:sortase A